MLYLLIYIFFFLILFKKSSCNFNEDVLHLVFAFVIFVAFIVSVATSGSVAGSVAGSVGSSVVILSKFFIENNLLLKLLRTFSLHPK